MAGDNRKEHNSENMISRVFRFTCVLLYCYCIVSSLFSKCTEWPFLY